MTEYTRVKLMDQMVFVRIKEGVLRMFVHLSNECNTSIELENAMRDWVEDNAPVEITVGFSIASPVDYMVEGHQMPTLGNAVDIDAKPVFDAIRAEMVKQIARIDALKFIAA